MRNGKNALISLLCIIIFLFNTTVNAFAINIINDNNSKLNDIVYVIEGDGSEYYGDGSENNPYRNIKTALKNVNAGGIIKIVGTVKYWYYEQHSTLLPRPLLINKEVTFEGVNSSSVFVTRAPIQLGADVAFKNIRMEFWASNEMFPEVPDSGFPGAPVDPGTEFRSGRSIYLAGHTLTLDNIDTRVNTDSFIRDYRPYISGGTFLDEGSNIGSKSVLNVINPNSGTQFAGIFAGDYWVERNYPVELNIRGEVLDKTVHTGGIIRPFNGDVVINIYSKTKISTIDNNNHNGNYDVNVKENVTILDAMFTGIRDLTLESGAHVYLKNSSDFTLDNLTINKDALLDLTKVTGDIKVNGDFIGYDNISDDSLEGGAIFLHNNQLLDINGDAKGNTRLNSYNSINKVDLKENHTYVKAKENASGNFVIDPEYYQEDYILEKNSNNSQRTTWTTIRNKNIFKDFRWTDNLNNTVINPENTQQAIYNIEYINEKDEVYMPFGEDWDDFSVTLEKPDGTILDTNGDDWDLDLGIYLYENEVIIDIYNISFSGEVILTVKHTSGKFITRRIQIGEIKQDTKPNIPATNGVVYQTHIEDYGWQDWKSNGEVSGTTGESKRLEGIKIKINDIIPGASIKYRTHVQDYGWQDWKSNGEMSGTSGESKRLEGIEIKLENAPGYSIEYRTHVQDYGWQDWKSNGEMSGTTGESKRLEGIEIRIVKDPQIEYRTHVQDYGWQDWKSNGETSGTSGEAKRLEGIEIKVENLPKGASIKYRTHVQDYGWQDWKSNGEMSGTSGEAKRLEGIEIKLENAPGYSIQYRTHVQDYGWQEWKSNGEMSGTSGEAKRLEAIEVRIVKNK